MPVAAIERPPGQRCIGRTAVLYNIFASNQLRNRIHRSIGQVKRQNRAVAHSRHIIPGSGCSFRIAVAIKPADQSGGRHRLMPATGNIRKPDFYTVIELNLKIERRQCSRTINNTASVPSDNSAVPPAFRLKNASIVNREGVIDSISTPDG